MKRGMRLAALALVFCMVFALALPAGAVEEETPRQEYVETQLFRNGSFTGEQTMPDSAITLEAVSVEDELYSVISAGLQSRAESIDLISLKLAYNETNTALLKSVYERVVNDNPRLIYVTGDYRFSYYSNGNIISLIPVYSEAYTDAMIADFEAAIQTALAQVDDGMSDLEKALVIHDYLVTVCQYNWDVATNQSAQESGSMYNAYGALVENDAVCQGYSEAYALLMNDLGIECCMVSSPEMGHAWNLICLDGAWYHVDVTYDDPVPDAAGKVMHTYFLLSDDTMSDDAHEHTGWVASVRCTSTKYESGYIFNDAVSEVHAWDGAYYYIVDGDAGNSTLYSARSVRDSGKIKATLTGLWKSGAVWLDDKLYFASQTFTSSREYGLQIMSCDLNSGLTCAVGEKISDTRSPSPDGAYLFNSDFVGLRLSTDGTMIEAVSSTRRSVLTAVKLSVSELTAPTNLQWGVYRDCDTGNSEKAPGTISWESTSGGGNFLVEVFRVGSEDAVFTVASSVPLDESLYPFGNVSLPWDDERMTSGTYFFTVKALGDGVTCEDSAAVTSDTWVYTRPDVRLNISDPAWSGDGAMTWVNRFDNESAVKYYRIDIYYSKTADGAPEYIGCLRDTPGDGKPESLPDDVIQQYGYGFYYFKVQALSQDVTAAMDGIQSELSAAFQVSISIQDVQEQLRNILSSNPEDVKTAVQALDSESLAAAMAADQDHSGAAGLIRQLESAADVTVNIEVTNREFGTTDNHSVCVVGAGLNAGDSGTVTLKIEDASQGVVIPEQYNLAVAFSMHLDGADDMDPSTDNQDLAVPVKITLPVPAHLHPAFLTILHYCADGSYEQILPYIYQEGGQWYAAFVATSFSDFAMCESIAAKTTGTGVQVMLKLALEQSGSGICAVYDADGKMLCAAGLERTGGEQTVNLTCNPGKAASVKVFLLDENNAPLFQAGETEI